ncbi:MAG TPA: ROK family protein [Anaerolineae bacterium]|nr:ROK family protein [Anaerolineae bacterium]HQH37054.1 ROK family protein [Anaerolineae bacterium]
MSLRFVAVALNQTDLQAVRYTIDGVQEARVTLWIDAYDSVETGLRRIRSAIRQVWPLQNQISAVGLSVPGLLDYKRGVLRSLPGFAAWVDVPLRETLVETLGVPVFIGKAADTAALGEHRFGVGQGVADMVYLALNESLECGTIYHNRLFTGGNGLGGELGYVVLEAPASMSPHSEVTCLETMLSGAAVLRRLRERWTMAEGASWAEKYGSDPAALTVAAVCAAAQQGDGLARAALQETGVYLGWMIVSLMHILDPSLFVLDGLVHLAGDALLVPLRETIAACAPAVYREHTRIVLAQLGSDVRLWGALALCLMELGL